MVSNTLVYSLDERKRRRVLVQLFVEGRQTIKQLIRAGFNQLTYEPVLRDLIDERLVKRIRAAWSDYPGNARPCELTMKGKKLVPRLLAIQDAGKPVASLD